MKRIVLESDEKKIGALAELEASLGWAVVSDYLQKNIEDLGNDILNDIDGEIKPEEKNRLILKRYFQKKLLDIPKQLSEYIRNSKSSTQEVNFDPFEDEQQS